MTLNAEVASLVLVPAGRDLCRGKRRTFGGSDEGNIKTKSVS